MKYVSIDIETTGLNPDTCDVIEFAAVIDDTMAPDVPVDQLPSFRCLIKRDSYRGEPFALQMHAELFRDIHAAETHQSERPQDADGSITPSGIPVCAPTELFNRFHKWLKKQISDPGTAFVTNPDSIKLKSVLVAGKNFAGFDLRFLRRLNKFFAINHEVVPDNRWEQLFSHRILDPAMFFTLAEDEKPPSLAQCLDRAGYGYKPDVSHRALDDAKDVVRCIRAGLSKVKAMSDEKRTALERELVQLKIDFANTTTRRELAEMDSRNYKLAAERVDGHYKNVVERLNTIENSAKSIERKAAAAEEDAHQKSKTVALLKQELALAKPYIAYLERWQKWAQKRMSQVENEAPVSVPLYPWDETNPEPKPGDE